MTPTWKYRMAIVETTQLTFFGEQIIAAITGDLIIDMAAKPEARCEQLRQLNRDADQLIEQLKQAELSISDNKVDVACLFEKARDALGAAYEKWRLAQVPVTHAEDATDACAPVLTEVASLHDKLNTLCWMIRELEADQDKTLPGEFHDPDDLFAAMGV
jgi:hypothetical protein